MTHPLRLSLTAVLASAVLAVLVLVASQQASAQPSALPRRAVIPMLASDGVFAGGDLPAPDPSYCALTGGTQQPSAVFGLVTIGGAPAPASAIVQLAFDGKAGPAERVTAGAGSSGYSLIFDTGGAGCANRAGAAVSVLVNGRAFPTGLTVGDDRLIAYRFDVAVP